MQTKYLYVLIHNWIKGEVGAPLNQFKPSSKIFYWPFQGSSSFVDILCYCSVLCVCCAFVRVCLYVLCGHLLAKLYLWYFLGFSEVKNAFSLEVSINKINKFIFN